MNPFFNILQEEGAGSVVLSLEDNEATRAMWDKKYDYLHVIYIFTIYVT